MFLIQGWKSFDSNKKEIEVLIVTQNKEFDVAVYPVKRNQ